MRNLILSMMTTLNGRLDAPFEWVDTVGEDHYGRINERAATSDTLLVGRTTYDEMVAYWPQALATGEGTASNQVMARHMHDVEKLVISRSGSRPLANWHKARQVAADSDAALGAFIGTLKAQPGGDIHLAGGARLAQSLVRLGLVDAYYLYVFPTVSPGLGWFAELTAKYDLELTGLERFESGVVGLTYRARAAKDMGAPERFTELLR